MGLASSLSTALTGMNAAETQIDVLGNNLANSQTVGFKASEAVFATQFLHTLSIGGSPTPTNGGTNPRQIGLGVQVAAINQNFKQGTVDISSSPSDLAIQGDGFFQVDGGNGEVLYTRNGIFKLNGANELVNSTGNRVLGYGVDDQFNIVTTSLAPITLPLGTEAIAKATSVVNLQGTLTPNGDIADTSKIVQSNALGTESIPRPSTGSISTQSAISPVSTSATISTTEGAGTHPEGVTYSYRFTYVDGNGTESMASDTIQYTVPAGNGVADNAITLNNLPPSNSMYSEVRVYRATAGSTAFTQVGSAAAGGTFTDTSPATTGDALNNQGLTGNYTYMVTYYKAGEPESRPSTVIGPQNIVNGRIHLSDLPTPPTPTADDGFPAYDEIRIYRNLANNPSEFYLVDTVPAGSDYTDGKSDAEISNLATAGNKQIDLDGPGVGSNTRLVDLISRDGLEYSKPFKEGVLSFTPRKGDQVLQEQSFTITSTTTVQDLLSFMKSATGIVGDSGDLLHPITSSVNNIPGESGTIHPDAYISNGALRLVSNTGVDNGITIDAGSFKMTDTNGVVTTPDLGFTTAQEAKGRSAATDFIAYDSLGTPIRVRISTVLEQRTDQMTVYRWTADSSDNMPQTGSDINVGTGLIYFDSHGNFMSATNSTVAVQRSGYPSESPMTFDLDFSEITGLAGTKSTIAAARQDGSPPGVMNSFVIGEDGVIRGVFSNGITRDLGQLRLARFTNPNGLEQRGNNLFAQGINSGLAIEGSPTENGLGKVSAGAVELSNTDVGGDLVTLVLASTQYRSNARVITATQQLFEELLNLRR